MVGHPRIEMDEPGLPHIIRDSAIYGSAADDKRRTQCIRSIKTLDDITEAVRNEYGINVSRSGIYLRMLSRRSSSIEGRQHYAGIPVKLTKASTEAHKSHIDTGFAASTIRNLEELASMLGSEDAFFISQDDKARVPIGITAATKQSPLLINMEYRIELPDHDWVMARGHTLIPSVYAGIVVRENNFIVQKGVSYSGPTYVGIRSSQHTSSTALSHAVDFEMLLTLPEFETLTKKLDGDIKPVAIFTVDGGPDVET